jgi:heme exporter protein C
MTFIALWTGALWGKPTWGTWWVWDARLTSRTAAAVPVPGLHGAAGRRRRPAPRRPRRRLLALVGVVNVPIIYFSVKWWNTLHQGATISLTRRPAWPASCCRHAADGVGAFWAYSSPPRCMRVRAIMLERERTPTGSAPCRSTVMHWQSWAEFLAMGGYGLYVWGSFGVTAVVLVGSW